jgi:hypothetical protein
LEYHGLSYYDRPISEAMVFGLAGGLGFGFGEIAPLDPPLVLIGTMGTLERDFCLNLDLSFECRQTDDPAEGWVLLREQLVGGRPTMIWTDIRHLDYRRVRMHNTHHAVVVTGYEEDEGIAWIADGDYAELQRCSLSALARARCSDAPPFGPNRHGTWLIDFPAALPDLERAATTAIRRSVENMTSPDDERMGLPGVSALAESYESWPRRYEHDLAALLRRLYVYIVKAGTGGALFRSLHAGWLEELSGLIDDEQLAETGRVYRMLADEWVRLAERISLEPAMDAWDTGRASVARIRELERAGVDAMVEWLDGPPGASR